MEVMASQCLPLRTDPIKSQLYAVNLLQWSKIYKYYLLSPDSSHICHAYDPVHREAKQLRII